MVTILPVAKPVMGRLGLSRQDKGVRMRYGLIAGVAVLMLAACGGGGTGPRDIQLTGGGSTYVPPAPGPHDLSTAERNAVQTAVAAQVRGARIASTVATRGDDGVVTVCGTLASGAPFIGVLTGSGASAGFSPSGIAANDPEARAVRKICAERQLTV